MITSQNNSRRWTQRRLQNFDYADPNHAFFITTRAIAGETPFTRPLLCKDVVESLYWLRTNRGMELYAYCLMPDHLHLLLRTRAGVPVDQLIKAFKSHTTKRAWQQGWTGKLWQPRFYDHVVRSSEDTSAIAQYILYNPVRANLTEQPEDYPCCGTLDSLER